MGESYESAFKKLEEIIKELESEDISLENSVEKYEEGLKLYEYCSKLLTEYEGRVKILMKENSEIREQDFQRVEDHD
ncbi:MAG: exodeoxyribonuclease VII small subunit [Peptoniphilus sp.]|nr:exodeoxyribonuclease VII small subunit [Peptoniphilus sp.]